MLLFQLHGGELMSPMLISLLVSKLLPEESPMRLLGRGGNVRPVCKAWPTMCPLESHSAEPANFSTAGPMRLL